MGYDVIMSEIADMQESVSNRYEEWTTQIGNVCIAIENFITELKTNGKGETVNAICNYLQEVHLSFAYAIQGMQFELKTRLDAYANGMFGIEGDTKKGRIPQDELNRQLDFLRTGQENFVHTADLIEKQINSIANIVQVEAPSTDAVEEQFRLANIKLTMLDQSVGNFEQYHLISDFVELESQLSNLQTLLDQYSGQTVDELAQYQAGSVYKTAEMKDIDASRDKLMQEWTVDGIVPTDEEWSVDLGCCHVGQVTYLDDDGIERINMVETRKILKKNADDITDSEYKQIGDVVVKANDKELTQVIKYCMEPNSEEEKVANYQLRTPNTYWGNMAYEEWGINQEKMIRIEAEVAKHSAVLLMELQLETNENNNKILQYERDFVNQKLTLLGAVREFDAFHSELGAEEPQFTISTIPEGEENQLAKIVSFEEYNQVGPSGGNYRTSTITIDQTTNGTITNMKATKEARSQFRAHFCDVSVSQGIADALWEQGKEQLQSNGEKVLLNTFEIAGSSLYVTAGGMIGGAAKTFIIEQVEQAQDLEFIDVQFDNLDATIIYSQYGASVNQVRYDTALRTGYDMYAYEGEHTYARVMEVNRAMGNDVDNYITVEQVLTKPNEIFAKADEYSQLAGMNGNDYDTALSVEWDTWLAKYDPLNYVITY